MARGYTSRESGTGQQAVMSVEQISKNASEARDYADLLSTQFKESERSPPSEFFLNTKKEYESLLSVAEASLSKAGGSPSEVALKQSVSDLKEAVGFFASRYSDKTSTDLLRSAGIDVDKVVGLSVAKSLSSDQLDALMKLMPKSFSPIAKQVEGMNDGAQKNLMPDERQEKYQDQVDAFADDGESYEDRQPFNKNRKESTDVLYTADGAKFVLLLESAETPKRLAKQDEISDAGKGRRTSILIRFVSPSGAMTGLGRWKLFEEV